MNMLSHLRFHRRGTSNPTPPLPELQQPFTSVDNSEMPTTLGAGSPLDTFPVSASSSQAPTLPPITRVASDRSDRGNHESIDSIGTGKLSTGVALQNRRHDAEAPYQTTIKAVDAKQTSNGYFEYAAWRQPPVRTEVGSEPHEEGQGPKISSSTTPTDVHATSMLNKGRRPRGARLPQDIPHLGSIAPGSAINESQRGKKGLPFLKNPMSTLLMRRRNNQNAPALSPLPLGQKNEEPIYDPRIRGTRVHDFSAPRKAIETHSSRFGAASTPSESHTDASRDTRQVPYTGSRETSSDKHRTKKHSIQSISLTQSSDITNHPSQNQPEGQPSTNEHLNLEDAGTAQMNSRSTIAHDSSTVMYSTPSLSASKRSEVSSVALDSEGPSRSRNVSLSEVSVSAIPRHMKSTSSRFSFDMVGAAKQERLLEERHRQRENDRKTTTDVNYRDSRFDDFDEDQFEYDASFDDDGLEERIPGVNADLDDEDGLDIYAKPDDISETNADHEQAGDSAIDARPEGKDMPTYDDCQEEIDFENDQENFAGFVFHRSNPTSLLTSPQNDGLMTTPRDTEGNVIGFAFSKDTPQNSRSPRFPYEHELHRAMLDRERTARSSVGDVHPFGPRDPRALLSEDDLYYDDGMIGFEDEFAGDLTLGSDATEQPFDESIFDNDDTDQFGRPLPGVFQQAQSLRRAEQKDAAKRESDLSSHLSAQSGISSSTAHTSVSADDGGASESRQDVAKAQESELDIRKAQVSDGVQSMAAYQAALAAAAHRAVASGKLQRSSSPSPSFPVQTADDSGSEEPDDENEICDYDDFDDAFSLDDDAIIAEANASALANDSDGWYGEEFGFYSAPPNTFSSSHAHGPTNVKNYEFANGGFFGPEGAGGLNRSTSGRMISREPNLTPITERSEYSNRNSFMGLGYPAFNSSTPIAQSPGLAQLAKMGESGDDAMTLSALLRLRSRTWGGSQVSLASSREGSPRPERGDITTMFWSTNFPEAAGQTVATHGKNHASSSDEGSISGSPTMTMIDPESSQKASLEEKDHAQTSMDRGTSQPPLLGTRAASEAISPALPDIKKEKLLSTVSDGSSSERLCYGEGSASNPPHRPILKSHRHKSSADSVSYVMEEDCGETRWVLERRRTADSGEVEVLEREFIEGRKI